MLTHMVVVAVAPPLWALAVRGLRLDPVPRAPRLFSAILASMFEFCAVWAFHTPALHAAARAHAFVWGLEQAAFLLSGTWLWLSALGGQEALRRSRFLANATGLLLTSMHMTLLGVLIAITPRLLHHAHAAGTLSPLQDQQLGGVIMLVVGGVAYLWGGLAVCAEVLRDPSKECAP
jgi:putative membrane protein